MTDGVQPVIPMTPYALPYRVWLPRELAAGPHDLTIRVTLATEEPVETAALQTASAVPTSTLLVTGAAFPVAPNILSIAHWDRLLGSCVEPSTWTSSAAPGAQGAWRCAQS